MSAPHLAAIVDHLADGVTVRDATGHPCYANAAAARLFGFATPADLVAASPEDVAARCAVFDETGAPVAIAGLPTEQTPTGSDGQERLPRLRIATTGAERWVAIHATPLVADDGSDLVLTVLRDVTGQVRAEAEARERAAYTRAILAALPDLLFLQSPDGTYLDYHAGTPSRLLVPPETFLGKTTAEVLPPNVAAQIGSAVERTARTGVSSVEQYALGIDGEVRNFEARLVRTEDGNVLGVVRDLTDRVRAEEALAANRRLADRVGAASPDIHYVFDVLESRIVYVNDAIGRVLGYSPEYLTGAEEADPMAMRHPDDRATLLAAVDQVAAAADGEVVEFAFRMRHANGDWRWLATRVTVLSREPDGRPRMVVGASIDVTALREAEATLRASESRYRAVVDTQGELISRWLPGTAIITFINDANCRALGLSREEVVGRSILDFVLPENRDRLAAYFASLTANPRTAEEVHEAVLADGTVGWYHWIDTPVFDAAGNLVEFQGVGRDITELRQAQESLRALSHRLLAAHEEERRVVARELHEGIGQILTGLNLVLAAERAPEAQRLAIEVIERVRGLATDLRPPELDDFGLVPALCGHQARLERRTGLRVELRASGADRRFPAAVEVAACRIVQEALANTARHAGVEEATVTLATDETVLTVTIRDAGRGFDPAAASGDGLRVMRERAEALGGTLRVETAPGAGVTVTASLPLLVPAVNRHTPA